MQRTGVYPVKYDLLDATTIMAVVARQAGVARPVDLVMLRSSADAPTPRMLQTEQVLELTAIGAAHVRSTVVYENVAALVGLSLSTRGTIRLPWGGESTTSPLISVETWRASQLRC